MKPLPPPWLALPGLAGGLDKDGGRAAELLASGFGSVEFGSVTADPLQGSNGGVGALVRTLAALGDGPGSAAIGIGLGLPPDIPGEGLAEAWVRGIALAAPVADYVSLNLSAQANRRFLAEAYREHLAAAFAAAAAVRGRMAGAGRRLWLAVKMPVGGEGAFPEGARLALAAGCDQVTAVLPGDGPPRLDRLAQFVAWLEGRGTVVAVGGIRSAADVAAARNGGAAGVQVHRLFAERGAACLAALLGDVQPWTVR